MQRRRTSLQAKLWKSQKSEIPERTTLQKNEACSLPFFFVLGWTCAKPGRSSQRSNSGRRRDGRYCCEGGKKLNADPVYRELFVKASGNRPIKFEMVEKSIATFERTNLSGDSPFDRWKYGHDEAAVSESVKRGFVVFTSRKKGNCAACHLIDKNYALFTDNKFHDIGVGVESGKISDAGLYAVTHAEADRGKFKTPSLRNIALTPPYMHDGSLKDLKQVMDFYIGAGNSHPNLDREIRPLDF